MQTLKSVPRDGRSAVRRVGVGVGAGVGLIFATTWLSCSPGTLAPEFDCGKPNCGIDPGGAPQPTGGGMGGGMGGTSGGMAGRGGGGGGGAAVAVNANTPLTKCPKYPTLGKMDDFFAMRCGTATLCHATGAPWTDLKMPAVWMRLLDKKPVVSCDMGKIIDKATPANSIMLAKTKQMMPVCPPNTGTVIGTVMPPLNNTEKQPPLTAEEVACIENFVTAAAGK